MSPSTVVSPMRSSRKRAPRIRWCSCRTTTSRCCRASSATGCRTRPSSTFWHIPWPNPESFGICPWRTEIIEGLLGSTILGFHTRYQAKNFIETADRFLETRIEHEISMISYGGVRTQVESYPISIDWPDAPSFEKTVEQCRLDVRQRLGVAPTQLLGLGVDRLDYTKGILERFSAVETMLERHPGDDRALHVRPDRGALALGARGVPELRGPRPCGGVAHQPSFRAAPRRGARPATRRTPSRC